MCDPAGVSKDQMASASPLDARPTNKEEFDTYRAALVEKMRSLESSPSYNGFLEDLVRDLCWNSEFWTQLGADYFTNAADLLFPVHDNFVKLFP